MQVQPLFANYLEPQIQRSLPTDAAASTPKSLSTGHENLLEGLSELPENFVVTTLAYPSDSDRGRINPLFPRPIRQPRPPYCGGIGDSDLWKMILWLMAQLRMRHCGSGHMYGGYAGCQDNVAHAYNPGPEAPTVTYRPGSSVAATDKRGTTDAIAGGDQFA